MSRVEVFVVWLGGILVGVGLCLVVEGVVG